MNSPLALLSTEHSLRLTVGQLILIALDFKVYPPCELALLPAVGPKSLVAKLNVVEYEDLMINPRADQALELASEFLNNTEHYVLGTALVTTALLHDRVIKESRTLTSLLNQENLSSMNEAMVLSLGLTLGSAVLDTHPQILRLCPHKPQFELAQQ